MRARWKTRKEHEVPAQRASRHINTTSETALEGDNLTNTQKHPNDNEASPRESVDAHLRMKSHAHKLSEEFSIIELGHWAKQNNPTQGIESLSVLRDTDISCIDVRFRRASPSRRRQGQTVTRSETCPNHAHFSILGLDLKSEKDLCDVQGRCQFSMIWTFHAYLCASE